MAKKQIRKIIKDFINAVKEKNIKVEAVFLFGSYAENRANEDSDIDVAVVSPDLAKIFLRNPHYLKN